MSTICGVLKRINLHLSLLLILYQNIPQFGGLLSRNIKDTFVIKFISLFNYLMLRKSIKKEQSAVILGMKTDMDISNNMNHFVLKSKLYLKATQAAFQELD